MSPEQKHSQMVERLKVLIDDLEYSDPQGCEDGQQASEMLDLLEECERLGEEIWQVEGYSQIIRENRKKHGDLWFLYRRYFP